MFYIRPALNDDEKLTINLTTLFGYDPGGMVMRYIGLHNLMHTLFAPLF